MSNVFIEEQTLRDIGDSIRFANGSDVRMKPSEMPAAIRKLDPSEATKVLVEQLRVFIERKASDGSDYTEYVIPDGITRIGQGLFYYYNRMKNVVIPSSVKYIDKEAFESCAQLALTELPDNIEVIGEEAFRSCGNLKLAKLPSSLKVIEKSAFYGCPAISISEIPESVEEINNLAFRGGYGLSEITFKGTPDYLADSIFQSSNVSVINVPWAEGEVFNAPWGATNATINYNYTGV